MFYWYLRHPHEILVDLDRGPRCPCLVKSIALSVRLGGGAETRIVPSVTAGHFHVIMAFPEQTHIGDVEAVSYALWLGSDPRHAGHDLQRIARGIPHPILLIASHRFPDFREPDRKCDCEEKHDTATRMLTCNVGYQLRNPCGTDWYGDTMGWI